MNEGLSGRSCLVGESLMLGLPEKIQDVWLQLNFR